MTKNARHVKEFGYEVYNILPVGWVIDRSQAGDVYGRHFIEYYLET